MRGINSDLVTGTGLTTLTVTSLTRVVNTAYAGKKILTFDSTERHAGLVTTDGTLYTWGNCQTYYGCGYSVGSSLATPDLSVFNGSNIDSIAVGRSSMIVLSNNTIYTIGDNVNGQSGTGAKSTYGIVTWTPISRTGVLAGLTFKSVFSSDYVSGLITSTGELYMWGSNFLGVLGGKRNYSNLHT
jgi:alpha-tubulin suppressor-like RCC1 family protein